MPSPKRGDVWVHPDFKFNDGNSSKKLIVILNTPQTAANNYLICKTTSKIRYNLSSPGCFSDRGVYVVNPPPFSLKTWVQFDPNSLFEWSISEMFLEMTNNGFHFLLSLPSHVINDILACIKKSPDISKHQLKMLS